jgi:hypothetical protein
MRHEIEAHDEHWKGSYEGIKKALKFAEPDLKMAGIANMELAEGQRLMLDASREATAGDWERAYHTQRMGHDSWRRMLVAHGIKTPTDSDILKAISGMFEQLKNTAGIASKSMASLAVLGNWR